MLATLLQNLSHTLKPSAPTQIAIGLSLYLSDKPEYIEQGEAYLVTQLKDIAKNNKGGELTPKLLEELIFQISRNP